MTFSNEQLDALKELISIGLGKGVAKLNSLTQSSIDYHIPDLQVLTTSDIKSLSKLPHNEKLISVTLPFEGSINGQVLLVNRLCDLPQLVAALDHLDPEISLENKVNLEVYNEIGNIVLNSVIGGISNILSCHLTFHTPITNEIDEVKLWNDTGQNQEAVILAADTKLNIRQLTIDCEIYMLIEQQSFDALLQGLVISNMMMGDLAD